MTNISCQFRKIYLRYRLLLHNNTGSQRFSHEVHTQFQLYSHTAMTLSLILQGIMCFFRGSGRPFYKYNMTSCHSITKPRTCRVMWGIQGVRWAPLFASMSLETSVSALVRTEINLISYIRIEATLWALCFSVNLDSSPVRMQSSCITKNHLCRIVKMLFSGFFLPL